MAATFAIPSIIVFFLWGDRPCCIEWQTPRYVKLDQCYFKFFSDLIKLLKCLVPGSQLVTWNGFA